MFVLDKSRITYFDCDDTLAYFGPIPEHYKGPTVKVKCGDIERDYAYIQENIDLLIEHKSRNHGIVVWTMSSIEWAEALVRALKLENYVDVIMGKPSWIVDDDKESRWLPKPRFGLNSAYPVNKEDEDGK